MRIDIPVAAFLVLATSTCSADQAPLAISVATNAAVYMQTDPITVVVTIENKSSISVAPSAVNVTVTRGSPTRIPLNLTELQARIALAKPLVPGESRQIVVRLNENHLGFRDVSQPARWHDGRFFVTASIATSQQPTETVTEERTLRECVATAAPLSIEVKPVTCADLLRLKTMIGTERRVGSRTPIDIRDLAAMSQQVPAGTVCK